MIIDISIGYMKSFHVVKLLVAAILCAFVFCACSSEPIDVVYDSYVSMEHIMRKNIDDPDALIAEMNTFVEANRDKIKEARKAFDEMGKDRKLRMIDQRLDELNVVTLRIVNLDLEIQDRLQNDPAKLEAYRLCIRNINFISPENDPRNQKNL